MKTYIINLLRSPERKTYMEEILSNLPVKYEFIRGIDGKSLSDDECNILFDKKKFIKRYYYSARPGDIGCALSHQKCYHKIIEDNEPYVLILEDDIEKPSLDIELINRINDLMKTDEPLIILLSGWYWYLNSRNFVGKYKLANVYDGVLAHAYVINQAAARMLVKEKPFILADDWFYIRKSGVKIQAICPHIVNQKWDGTFKTTINIGSKTTTNKIVLNCKNFIKNFVNKILGKIGHFEEPNW